jgi:hypothetical protein
VYTFQEILIKDLKKLVPNLKKISYFTDGAGGQYKNKSNFINLCHHEQDFGVTAVWNFSATRKVYFFILYNFIFFIMFLTLEIMNNFKTISIKKI